MRRRQFLALLGGASVLSLPVQAQQPSPPVIGFLSSRVPDESAHHTAAFLQGLEASGYVIGRNVAIEYRWAEGRYDRLPALAAELVGQHVTVIAAVGGIPSALAAKAATSTIPIVFLIGDDPVQVGLVQSLNRPGGNITGVTLITTELGGKRLEMLNEMVLGPGPVAVLVNPTNANTEDHIEDVRTTANSIKRPLLVARAAVPADFEPTFEMLSAEGVRALVVQNDPYFDSRRDQLVRLAASHAIPAIYHIREFPEIGGLMSYGPSLLNAYRQIGDYTGRALKGAAASQLPVLQPTRFELVVNAKAAQALGLAIPASLLARADDVVE
jgi:putative tryptophan/tyrosine transport system substrate-binding protein